MHLVHLLVLAMALLCHAKLNVAFQEVMESRLGSQIALAELQIRAWNGTLSIQCRACGNSRLSGLQDQIQSQF